MYLTIITFGMCVAYLVFAFAFPKFFKNKFQALSPNWAFSILYIIIFSVAAHYFSLLIPNDELSNRVLHALGGGFAAFFICFLVFRDSKIQLTRFQFFVFSFLVVTALGTANEIIEFFLQNNYHLIFAPNTNDTWQDLISNTVGALAAGICFTPFIKTKL